MDRCHAAGAGCQPRGPRRSLRAPRLDSYRRREPEHSVLYETIAVHWPEFRQQAEEAGGLPKFVEREFDEYLTCGRLEHGCMHLLCRKCGHSQLVGLSCKRRGICSSCAGRRMADAAAHLEHSVLPEVPIRHWICSLPWGLRALLGYDRKLCSEVVSAVMGELSRLHRRRAKQLLGLDSVGQAHTGAVASIHRVDGALRLNVHLHVLSVDGVYVRAEDTGALQFHPLPTPTQNEVAEVARRSAARVEKILQRQGRSLDPEMCCDEQLQLELEEPGLAACYAAAARGVGVSGERAGQPTLRLVIPADGAEPTRGPNRDEPVAEVRGFNLHAKQVVDGRDRQRVEQLCRYILRPPLAQDRLEERADGLLQLTLKRVWKDGTRALLLEPNELIARLVAAIPPPRFHQLRYFGVLSGHSAHRAEVVRQSSVPDDAYRPGPAEGDQLSLSWPSLDAPASAEQPSRHRWGWLLKHVFLADLDICPRCGGPMRWVEVATGGRAQHLMVEHGLAPEPPAQHRPRPEPLGQLKLPFAG